MNQFEEEYILVNGIEHFLLHYPKTSDAPVLLYLHGGPGSFESLFAYELDKAGEIYLLTYTGTSAVRAKRSAETRRPACRKMWIRCWKIYMASSSICSRNIEWRSLSSWAIPGAAC